jgi:hypothetical protein
MFLSISTDARESNNFSLVYRQVNTGNDFNTPLVLRPEIRCLQHGSPSFNIVFLYVEQHIPADHHPSQFVGVGFLSDDCTDLFAFTEYGNPVGDRINFI